MKFTHKELASIEQTVGKLATTVGALCDYESTERANMRYLTYIIAELRTTAGLMADQDKSAQQAGLGRVFSLFANLPE
jgi:hypothetical protein